MLEDEPPPDEEDEPADEPPADEPPPDEPPEPPDGRETAVPVFSPPPLGRDPFSCASTGAALIENVSAAAQTPIPRRVMICSCSPLAH
jgi:hypothetical protein